MKVLFDYEREGLIIGVTGSTCWTKNGKPLMFYARRGRIAGGHLVQVILFWILAITIAYEGKSDK